MKTRECVLHVMSVRPIIPAKQNAIPGQVNPYSFYLEVEVAEDTGKAGDMKFGAMTKKVLFYTNISHKSAFTAIMRHVDAKLAACADDAARLAIWAPKLKVAITEADKPMTIASSQINGYISTYKLPKNTYYVVEGAKGDIEKTSMILTCIGQADTFNTTTGICNDDGWGETPHSVFEGLVNTETVDKRFRADVTGSEADALAAID